MTGTTLDGAWTIDPTHSRIGFSSRHAMVSRVRGAFNAVAGRAVIDTADFSRSTVSVQVELASIDTRNADRDDPLRSADFFDIDNHPFMTFDSTQVEEVDDDSFIVSGDLSIRGITRPLSVPLSFVGIEHDPMGSTRAGFEGARRIDRRDWGIEWNTPLDSGGLLVSDKITLEFELSLVKETPPAAPTEAPPTAG
jgi:polyisoprenoid-binding protein YceI